MESERREDVRFMAKNNSYASFGPGFTKVGSLKDISKGGLSFEYIFYEELDKEPSSQVDIFLSMNGFHLESVPCRMVYDVPHRTSTNNLFIVKRCGLSFEDLTQEQAIQLYFFLENHTSGIAFKKE